MDTSDEIRQLIAQMRDGGWTIAAIAGELGVSRDSVESWAASPGSSRSHHPANPGPVLALLRNLAKRKRPPKRHRT